MSNYRITRYAYNYEFTNGDKGTWLTDIRPERAREELLKRFVDKEIKAISLLSGGEL